MSSQEVEWDGKEPRWVRVLVLHAVLRHLVARNKRLRAMGVLPDKWYWADYLAVQWGYFVE